MGCLDVIRILLASINVFLNGLGGLYGLALIAQGSAGLILFNIIGVFSDNEHLSAYNTVFFFTLAMGVVLLLFCVVAIIGSCVACCPNNSILKVVASVILTADLIAVFFCFLLGIAGAVLVFVYRDTVTAGLIPVLHEGLIESYTLAPNETHAALVAVQNTIGCCGISSPADFADYPGYPLGDELPDSCCDANTTTCTIATAQNETGCGTYLVAAIVEYSNIIGGIGIGQVVILLLLIVLEIALITLVVSKDNDNFARV